MTRPLLAALLSAMALPAAAGTVTFDASVLTTLDLPEGVVIVEGSVSEPQTTLTTNAPDAAVLDVRTSGDALDFTFLVEVSVPRPEARGPDAQALSAEFFVRTDASVTLRNDTASDVEVPIAQSGGFSLEATVAGRGEGERFVPLSGFASINGRLFPATGEDEGRSALDEGFEEETDLGSTVYGFDNTDFSPDPLVIEAGAQETVQLVFARASGSVSEAPAPIPLPAAAPLLLAGLGALGLARRPRRAG